MRQRRLAFALALVVAAAPVHASCSPAVEAALRAFKAQPAIGGDVVTRQCKPWPPSAGKVIAAVMAFADPQADDSFGNLPGVLALVDARTHKILHGRRFTVYEDAATQAGPRSLVLDTADYTLAPGVRALGLRFFNASSGPGVVESRRRNELTLLVPRNGELQPVFGLPMDVARAVEGCLGRCRDATWDEATLTLAVGAPGPAGWKDLVVTARIARDSSRETPSPQPHVERSVYRYDGARYNAAAGMRWWNDSPCCTPTWDETQ